jgi:hypothetical protein
MRRHEATLPRLELSVSACCAFLIKEPLSESEKPRWKRNAAVDRYLAINIVGALADLSNN